MMSRHSWLLAVLAGGFVLAVPVCAVEPALAERTDIIIFEEFESPTWFVRWGMHKAPRNLVLSPDREMPAPGKTCARILYPRGEHYGSGWSYRLDGRDKRPKPLEEAYLRWYVKFDADFDFDRGGKMPGLMGWAPGKRAGWGGKRSDGNNGFSCRICWSRGGKLTMYTYHADQRSKYGDGFETRTKANRPYVIERGRWICIEMYMKLNSPGRHDGVLKLWADGIQIGQRDGIRFRNLPTMKIDNLFVNAYFGGSWTSPKDQHVHYDNMVMARKYIGPFVKSLGKTGAGGTFTPPPGW